MQVNANAMMSISNWMGNSANNVANLNVQERTTTNQGSEVDLLKTEKRTDLAKEMTDQIQIEKTFDVNAKAIKTQNAMIGSLLDLTI